jgi:hypothetical protein
MPKRFQHNYVERGFAIVKQMEASLFVIAEGVGARSDSAADFAILSHAIVPTQPFIAAAADKLGNFTGAFVHPLQ